MGRGGRGERENYCLAKADVDVALLHKSYGFSIVASCEPALVTNGRSFAFSEPIRERRGREEEEKGGRLR